MSFMGQSHDEINSNMKKLLPETADNNYADYPMTGGKWLTGKDKAARGGGYCFIRTENMMPKGEGHSGYVWGSGVFGFGYYHLLTRDAHRTLYHRIESRKVFTGADTGVGCGCFGSTPKPDAIPTELPVKLSTGDLDVLRNVFHARSVSSLANDAQARLDQQTDASNTAQATYGYDQNYLLTTTIVNTVNR
jgi:hypothetical protein